MLMCLALWPYTPVLLVIACLLQLEIHGRIICGNGFTLQFWLLSGFAAFHNGTHNTHTTYITQHTLDRDTTETKL